MTTTSNQNSGCFRGYSNEQKTLRAKLDHLLKWTRDLKSNILKQSCKVTQNKNSNSSNGHRQIIDQIHDDLDEYKRKFDRELGRIHDICDALMNNSTQNDKVNLHDEILQALRLSPTYSSLEQHIDGDNGSRLRIRMKPRENHHPGQNRIRQSSPIFTKKLKGKASRPITLDIIDTSTVPGGKQRSRNNPFKRSRSYTNVEHTETQLGMEYIEEDECDLSWKPFGPKRPILEVSASLNNHERPTTSSIRTNQSLLTMSTGKLTTSGVDDDSSDEEFDIAWERRVKRKARKEATNTAVEVLSKRTVRFSPSTYDPTERRTSLDLDETTQNGSLQTRDQNNNHKTLQTEIISIDDDENDETISKQNQTTSSSSLRQDNGQNGNTVLDDDEIIALSDEDISRTVNIPKRKLPWTTSDIQVTYGNSQSQPSHNPYRIGITDPSIRSVFLPLPNSQLTTNLSSRNRKAVSSKRTTSSKL
ncbi:unnamed protein product [Adineta ricciae]|uniref:Uncharacterized protein n=1 Tax=Adineta ricciae TaxID=249248 RepID=A0A815PHV2_ADIRI|nr:unnamed protein product [Adineta ricciae]CAF1449128.1 unnamed protein product [Adineta ricciae]